MDKSKLQDAINREIYRLVADIKESMVDHTMIYLNKNQIDVDRNLAMRLLDIARGGVESALLSRMDMFNEKISKELDQFVDDAQDLPPSAKTKNSKK